jgi:gluconolactonase
VTAEARLLAQGLRFPEAPTFDANGQLWCVELDNGCITRIESDGTLDRHEVGGRPTGLALGREGQMWFCDSHRNEVRVFCSASGRSWPVAGSADGHDLDAPNDLAFDPAGNLIFSCPGQSRAAPTGYLSVLRPSGACTVAGRDLQFPNGLAFGRDGSVLYLAETYRQRVWQGGWDAQKGWWTPETEILRAPGPNGPDGLAVDQEGRVFTAVYGAGCIMSVRPGGRSETLPMGGRCPTSCAFDPSEKLGLVVTEAQTGTVLALPQYSKGLPLHVPLQVSGEVDAKR